MKRRSNMAHSSRRMAMCAVLCALAVVILGLGTLIEIFDLTAAALASLILLPVLLSYGSGYAWLSYTVTAVLGVILMPQSFAAWTFAGLIGYYPIIKQKLDRLPRLLGWTVKILLLAVVLCLYVVLVYFLILGGQGGVFDSFMAAFGDADGKPVMAWLVVGLSVFTFIVFDLLIDRLLILYRLKWQKQIQKWMKP